MRILALLALFLVAVVATAEEAAPEPVAVPDPQSLAPDWWNFIADAGDEVSARIDSLLELAEARVSETQSRLETPDEEMSQNLERLRRNLAVLPELRVQTVPPPEPVPLAAEEYRFAEYLEIAHELRQHRRQDDQQSQDILRAEKSERAAVRRGDNLLAAYLALPPADPLRVSRGLQIMATRAALAVVREQQRQRRQKQAGIQERIDQLAALLDQAGKSLSPNADQLAAIDERLAQLGGEAEATQTAINAREANALGMIGETPLDAARSAWRAQRVVESSARLRDIELEIATLHAAQSWIAIRQVEMSPEENAADLAATLEPAQQRLVNIDRLVQATRDDLGGWEEQSERELVALRSAPSTAVNANLLEPVQTAQDAETSELLDLAQIRLETAQQSLRNIQAARDAADDAELVASVIKTRVYSDQGVVAGGVASVWSWIMGVWQGTRGLLSASLFKIGDTPVTSFGLLRILLILIVALIISRLLRHTLGRIGSKKEGTQSAFYTVGRLTHYLIIGAAIVIGLSSIGLNFANLAIVAGALGVGIGFGLQSIVSNFVSGLIILFERSLKVGDYIQLSSGVQGVVKEINVRSTLINTNENLDILVPNSEFVNGQLTNWTLKEASRRMHISFGVAYGSDKDLVRKAVLEAANEISFTVTGTPGREAQVWLVNFGDSSLDFELVVWVRQVSVRRPGVVNATYTWAIETALGKYGIEIPFPQRDLHLRSGLEKLQSEKEIEGQP